MSVSVRIVDQVETTDEQIVSHFRVETGDDKEAHLYIWEGSQAKNISWECDAWYEIRGVQRKEFGEIIELNVVAETRAERIHSEEKITKLQAKQHSSSQSSSSLFDESNFTIEDTLEWLQEESEFSEQIEYRKAIAEQDSKTKQTNILPRIQEALESMGVNELYYHQSQALNAARTGSNLVLASDTASGKSLPYQIYACEKALKNNSTTLYIAPYRALINDQAETFGELINKMNMTSSLSAEVYHGDVPRWKKKRIRRAQSDILLMTPEQVQKSLLAWHDKIWAWFLKRLDTIIIDEIHEFRGIFGSHISHVCRRLNRLTSHYDSDPQYFCCSATIGNPKEHASNISDNSIGSFVTIEEDASGKGTRHWLLYNPPYKLDSSADPPGPNYPENWGTIRKKVLARDNYTCTKCGVKFGRTAPGTLHADHIIPAERGGSHAKSNLRTLCTSCHDSREGHSISTIRLDSAKTAQEVKQERERLSNQTLARQLFIELVSRGHQTVVFEKTRQGTERYAEITTSELIDLAEEELAERIRPYHSHLPNDTREEIESGLQSGEIRGVWSTSALEVGIDVGGLDAVILSGHPGTTMELFQRAGRAGRGSDDCLILFVASGDPLDQYCITNPDKIFEDSPSSAATNVENSEILGEHILCAAEEQPLIENDDSYPVTDYESQINTLEQREKIAQKHQDDQLVWECQVDDPQQSVSLRGISGLNFNLIIDGTKIDTTLSLRDAIKDCHPHAIYMFNKQKYKVTQFDTEEEKIHLTEFDGSEFTQAHPEEAITINNIIEERQPKSLQNVTIGIADVTYQNEIHEYLFKEDHDDQDPEKRRINQDLPTFELNTEALYLTIPDSIRKRASKITKVDHPFLGGIHGVEHLLMSLFPLEILCEREDIGGFSQISHPQTGCGTIFIYDNIPGGVGLSQAAFEETESLLKRAYDLVANCGCEHGCPRCIQSSRCQVGNRGLHKDLTILTLKWIKAHETHQ